MLSAVAASIKTTLIPGSIGFLLAGVVAGVAMLYIGRLKPWGRRWLLCLTLGYLLLATPLVSRWLEQGTKPMAYVRIDTPQAAGSATAIVVLGNGLVTYRLGDLALEGMPRRTAYNVMEGARLYRLLHPAVIFTSGGRPNPEAQLRSEAEAMRDALVSLGVPLERITVEATSVNTHEQAERMRPLLAQHPKFVLVTTPIHMGRALGYFRAQGMQPVPSPSPIDYMPEPMTLAEQFIPSPGSLRVSEISIYEFLGVAYGWTQGWLAAREAPQ